MKKALSWYRPFSTSQLIALSFVLCIAVGTLLLALPISHAKGQNVGILDALFTATSAVCVTGLATVDVATVYSRFGHVVIMLLCQVGGLGVLTLGALLAFATGRQIGFGERLNLQAQLNTDQVGGIVRLIKSLILVVVICEITGALLLYTRFYSLEGAIDGMFFALFHSVSAFNNAGFALYSNSLMNFVTDPVVSITIMLLIVLGGLGFTVMAQLLPQKTLSRRKLSLHSKIALTTTGVLLILGFVLTLVLEWNNPKTLGNLALVDKILAAAFQGVTPRTAGFNTLDYAAMTPSYLLVTMLLMFIGANPGSTGGGVKTVTFFLLLMTVWSIARGKKGLDVWGRHIPTQTILRASVIAFTGVLAVVTSLILLTLTDRNQPLLPLLFETISAFATVGLSMGITSQLSSEGKAIIIVLMYFGRIGLLTFALALMQKEKQVSIRYPREEIMVG